MRGWFLFYLIRTALVIKDSANLNVEASTSVPSDSRSQRWYVDYESSTTASLSLSQQNISALVVIYIFCNFLCTVFFEYRMFICYLIISQSLFTCINPRNIMQKLHI